MRSCSLPFIFNVKSWRLASYCDIIMTFDPIQFEVSWILSLYTQHLEEKKRNCSSDVIATKQVFECHVNSYYNVQLLSNMQQMLHKNRHARNCIDFIITLYLIYCKYSLLFVQCSFSPLLRIAGGLIEITWNLTNLLLKKLGILPQHPCDLWPVPVRSDRKWPTIQYLSACHKISKYAQSIV